MIYMSPKRRRTKKQAALFWCGPALGRNERSNHGFADGHFEAMKGFWYYGNTPWLDPNGGGP
jgi:hypothetical protein